MKAMMWALLAVLLLIGPASASQAGFSVEGVTLNGEATAEGRLAALRIDGSTSPDVDGALHRSLHIEGKRIDVVVAHEDHDMSAYSLIVSEPSRWNSNARFEDAVVDAIRIGESHDLRLIEDGQGADVRMEAPRLRLEASEAEWLTLQPRLNPDEPPIQVAVGDAHQGIEANSLSVEARGDFHVILWDVDVNVETGDNQTVLWSGERRQDTVANPLRGPGIGSAQAQEVHLFIQDGLIRLTTHGDWHDLYLRTDSVSAPGGMRLHDALPLAGGVPIAHLDLPNAKEATVDSPSAQRFSLYSELEPTVTEEPASILHDAWVTAVQVGGGSAVLIIPAMIGAFAFITWQLRRRHDRSMASLRRAMDKRDYADAVRLAEPLLRIQRFVRDVVVIKTVALLRLGRSREAHTLLASLPPSSSPAAALGHYLRACALADMGRRLDATRQVRLCLEADPGFLVEMRCNPNLAGLIDDVDPGPSVAAPLEAYA